MNPILEVIENKSKIICLFVTTKLVCKFYDLNILQICISICFFIQVGQKPQIQGTDLLGCCCLVSNDPTSVLYNINFICFKIIRWWKFCFNKFSAFIVFTFITCDYSVQIDLILIKIGVMKCFVLIFCLSANILMIFVHFALE